MTFPESGRNPRLFFLQQLLTFDENKYIIIIYMLLMRDGENVEEMQFVTVYRAPMPLRITTAAGFIVTALLMTLMPSYICQFNSSGVAGGYKLGVSGALTDIGTTGSYVIWLFMFICFFAGLVFTWNDRPKVIPIIASGFLTFATIYSSTLLKISGETENFGIVKEYAMNKSFYFVLVANWILTVMTIILIIKTKKKVELKFESDE